MRGVEDDWRPPFGRLKDLERRRHFAIKPGHRRAPFLLNPLVSRGAIQQHNGAFMGALSGIATVLPSEKSSTTSGMHLEQAHNSPLRRFKPQFGPEMALHTTDYAR